MYARSTHQMRMSAATRHSEHMERQQSSALITREAVQSLEVSNACVMLRRMPSIPASEHRAPAAVCSSQIAEHGPASASSSVCIRLLQSWGSAVQAHLHGPCECSWQAMLVSGRPLACPLTDACPRMQELTGYVSLQAELDNGESVKALRRFNRLLSNLPADSWGEGLPTEAHAEQGLRGLSAECHCPAWQRSAYIAHVMSYGMLAS